MALSLLSDPQIELTQTTFSRQQNALQFAILRGNIKLCKTILEVAMKQGAEKEKNRKRKEKREEEGEEGEGEKKKEKRGGEVIEKILGQRTLQGWGVTHAVVLGGSFELLKYFFEEWPQYLGIF